MTIHNLKTTLTRIWTYVGTSDRGAHSCSQPRTATMQIGSSTYCADLAYGEGWGMFYCGHRQDGTACYELQALDESTPGGAGFADDVSVWEHVVEQARNGSPLHLAALEIIDCVELRLIRYWCSAGDLAP